ncbi:translocation and assembly module lipoprotein TamL [Algoriphagus boritolerans]|uniref:Outer membrane protein assembly factor BamA n=1 Tax=Algoriphagus boritolerans DSM 17298 = JCM 18970 TaxID=1120964 RepID=A0A1H5X408_9BACT|nr:BamA/TamA family outer membrane protein [Algoriphagus boritolerans]SEG06482.1 Outer membrane protein assembly factor BamA [Algoriphagus boritolerans DSM 17298 = JCM 18970]
MKTFSAFFTGMTFILALTFGCSVKKFIPEDEYLYTGATLELKSGDDINDIKEVTEEVEALLRPEPNKKILGMYVGLWAYYKGTQEKPGFINRFLNKKLGEKPIYFSEVNPPQTEELILNRLENRGFFYSITSSDVRRKGKFADLAYTVQISSPYLMDSLMVDRDSMEIDREIIKLLKDTELKPGTRFDLSKLNTERVRIEDALKSRGYYNFNDEYLIFEADTNSGDSARTFNLYLRFKNSVSKAGIIPYKVDEINVFPNYSIDDEAELIDTVTLNGKNFIQGELVFKPNLLDDYILIEKDSLYDPTKSRLSSNRLSSIGNYRFVNLRYEELEADDTLGHLRANIYLSPMAKRSLRAELQGISKSNNFAGPAVNVIYRNRNLFDGGETLNLTGKFAYEFQVGRGGVQGLNSVELGLKADLIYPRVIFFIPIKERFSYSVPKTKISLGTEFLDRGGLYRLNTFSGNYGYFWNANRFVYHEINPVSINVVNLTKTSEEFESILDSNPFLRNSFQRQFIAGVNYTFNYNKLADKFRTHAVFVGVGLDLAGSGLNAVSNIIGSKSGELLGMPYAHYAKADLDLRYYFRFSKEHTLATRFLAGVGKPLGRSVSLPYVKQFFAGGPNSIRAFRIRSLGPGTYRPEVFNQASFFDQAGDIRLEGNLEYRFPIISVLKGAAFFDAGNLWLMNENESLPGGKFTSSWWDELAVGTGIGLRVDIEFFVIRFDLATPLRIPSLPENERWVRNFDFGDKSWRRDNLIFNFAIGFPF